MRLARDFGDFNQLVPEPFVDIRDAPYPVFDAVRQALVFLAFMEMEKKERPPREIWLSDRLLEEHFDAVERNREAERKASSGDGPGPIEDAVENDAAKRLLVG